MFEPDGAQVELEERMHVALDQTKSKIYTSKKKKKNNKYSN